MIIVIADDITGAAEIAGVALRYGLNTTLTIGYADVPKAKDVWVIATDTRSENENKATGTVKQIAEKLPIAGNIIFKKTDSVLRGHIVAELKTLMCTLGYKRVLFLPQNPTKGRIIKDGNYYINNIPLSDTDFSFDPEFPAKSSSVIDVLGNDACLVFLPYAVTNTKQNAIYIAEASNQEQVETQLNKIDNGFILAGGADLFETLLKKMFRYKKMNGRPKDKIFPKCYSIIVCGSTQSGNILKHDFADMAGTCVVAVSSEIVEKGIDNDWIMALVMLYNEHKSLAVISGERENRGAVYAVKLRSIMAETVKRLVAVRQPDQLIIEGGATAYAVVKSMGWNNFDLVAEYAPGIVGMSYRMTEIILKPGSYSWGKIL